MTRSTAFFINGGAGRVLCSIPAFEKFAEENPDDDFIIVCEGGMDLYKGHPLLHNKAFDVWHKGLFEDKIKDRNCISPEPYRVWEYYNQKCSLAQAFDITINNKGLRDVGNPNIHFNKHEIVEAHNVIQEVKAATKFDKVVVVQPFGRTVENRPDFVIDGTSRSMTLNNTVDIINELKKDYAVILMSEFPIALDDTGKPSDPPVAMPQIPELRLWAGIIHIADHFIGCDSVGQHIAKAVDTSVTAVIGSTFPINISYPEDKSFDIIDVGEGRRKYSPIRLTGEEEQDRFNDECMEMNDKQIKSVINSAKTRLGKSEKFTGTFAPQQQEQTTCSHQPQQQTQQVFVPQNTQSTQILGRTGE